MSNQPFSFQTGSEPRNRKINHIFLVKQESTQGAARCQLRQSSVSNCEFSICNEGLTGLCAKDCTIVWRFRWVQGLALRFMRGQEHHAIAKAVFGLMCTYVTASLSTRCGNNTLVAKKPKVPVTMEFSNQPQPSSLPFSYPLSLLQRDGSQ